MKYVENPNWTIIFDSVPPPVDRDVNSLKSSNEEALSLVEYLDDDLKCDEDGDVDYRAKKRLEAAVKTVKSQFSENVDIAKTLYESLEVALTRVDELQNILLDMLKDTNAVLIEDDKQGEVREWANDNLRGDWDFHVYTKRQFVADPCVVFIYVIDDPVDRVNFKMRWG